MVLIVADYPPSCTGSLANANPVVDRIMTCLFSKRVVINIIIHLINSMLINHFTFFMFYMNFDRIYIYPSSINLKALIIYSFIVLSSMRMFTFLWFICVFKLGYTNFFTKLYIFPSIPSWWFSAFIYLSSVTPKRIRSILKSYFFIDPSFVILMIFFIFNSYLVSTSFF